MTNPFHPEQPIINPSDFWGRRAELSKIFSRINADHPQCISIIGERKIGKTSLINVISNEEIYSKYLKYPEAYVIIKFDVDDRIEDVDSFFGHLISTISNSFGYICQNSDTVNGYQFLKDFINKCMKEKKKIIILLDDFDRITSNSEFPIEFFAFLRSVANSYHIAYVTTSTQSLQKVCVIKDVEESPFFNIFSSLHLKLPDSISLLQQVMKIMKTYNINEDGQSFVKRTSAYHPYVMQVVGKLIIEHNGKVNESIALLRLKEFFSQLWFSLSKEERKLVKMLAYNKKLPEKMRYMTQELNKRSILFELGGKWSLFSTLFKLFILKEHSSKGYWFNQLFSPGDSYG
ncbi:ATP-binding protein [bacterium]|nr:ATP-binding protein [bacterium]